MAYSLLEITYGLTGSFRAGDTSPSPRYWDSNTAPGSRYAGSGSLSSWWRLNDDVSASGNVIDWNGNANPGTFADIVTRPTYSSTLTPSTYVQNAVTGSSRLSGSCTFDGDDNGVTVGTAATWNDIIGNGTNGTSLMTFVMWVYKTGDGSIGAGTSTGRFFDFGRGNESAADGVVRMWSNASEKIRFNTLWDDVWKDFDTAVGVFSLNTWTHVAITYDATAGSNVPKIYINGSEVTVTAQDSAGTAWNGIKVTDCTIANHRVGGYGWQGSMGDVAVWNSILTAEEIKAVYEISNTGAYKIVRNFELRGSNADPGFTGSVARFIQGYNVDSYDRFAAAITPLIGRGDINNVFLSSSSGVTEVPRTAYFDESRNLKRVSIFEKELLSI